MKPCGVRVHGAALGAALAAAWPELQIVAEAGSGDEALMLFERERPELLFLDIRMPAPNGLEVARQIAGRCHVVFVTAYDAHAVEAFERGAGDYLLKPVDPDRLAITVSRLKQRGHAPPPDLDRLASLLASISREDNSAPARLRWIQATAGNQLRIIAMDEILFFQATDKYTRVVIRNGEALIRKPLKELIGETDPKQFWQIHRATIVNIRAVANVARDVQGRLIVSIKDHPEPLEVSRGYAHLFKSLQCPLGGPSGRSSCFRTGCGTGSVSPWGRTRQ